MRRLIDGDARLHVDSSTPPAPAQRQQQQQRPRTWPLLFSVTVALAGTLAFGYHLGIVNGSVEQITFELGIGSHQITVTCLEGLVVSIRLLGVAIGNFAGERLSNWIGRRQALLLAAQLFMLGPITAVHAPSFEYWNGPSHQCDGRPKRVVTLMASRLAVGMAGGLTSAVAPVYINEVSWASMRPTLGFVNQLAMCLGIIAALAANLLLPVRQWRACQFFAELPALMLRTGMLLCPESPVWLASKGRVTDADAAAKFLWGPHAASELDASTGDAPGAPYPSSTSEAGVFQIFSIRRPLQVILMLFPFQAVAGINMLIYGSSAFLRAAGAYGPRQVALVIGMANLLGAMLAPLAAARLSRRTVLTISCMGQATSMFTMVAFFTVTALKPFSSSVVVAGCLLYALSFALRAAPPAAVSMPAFHPLGLRGTAAVIPVMSHWVCSIAVAQVIMLGVNFVGITEVCFMSGVAALLGALYAWTQIPDAQAKSID